MSFNRKISRRQAKKKFKQLKLHHSQTKAHNQMLKQASDLYDKQSTGMVFDLSSRSNEDIELFIDQVIEESEGNLHVIRNYNNEEVFGEQRWLDKLFPKEICSS